MTFEGIHKVTIVQGPRVGPEIELQPGATKIGRDAASGIVIDAQGESRLHAQISLQAGRVQIEDLGSSNGTFVNGQRVSGGVQSLNSGDSIKPGQSVKLRYDAPVQVQSAATMVEVEPNVTQLSQPPVVHTAPEPAGTPIPPEKPAPATPPPAKSPVGGVIPAQTMFGDSFEMAAAAAPPELRIETASSAAQTLHLTKSAYTIGRSEDNDIVVASKIVSRHHARLEKTPQGYRAVQLPDVGNQMNYKGRPLSFPQDLDHGDVLRIGGVDPGTMVTLRYAAPETAAAGLQAVIITFGDRTVLQIGRDPENDIRLDVTQVSRYHAQIERVGGRYRVRDLRSTNGTFVNGERITGDIWLDADDQGRVGPYRFVVGEDRLAQFDESRDLRVDVIGVNKWVRKDLNILQNISLVFNPREFIVVVGQSGGGKSTLVDAIAGYRPATHGQVLVNDINVYKNFDAIRNEIGFVPQRDIIHMELTVFQALDYTARLRMPSDTSKQERHNRINDVLDDLDLAHRKDVQISGLSGGQQKRVSIGVELLTKPGLFFLDEPTSGLDPGTETALMQLMRRLADQGRTITLITHATKNVMLADKVVFLARGGHLAWFGPPDEALRYFDQYRSERDRRAGDIEFDEIYAILEQPSKGTAEEWGQRYQEHEAFQKHVVQPLQSRGQAVNGATAQSARPVVRSKRKRQVSAMRQFLILSARNMKILTRDRFSLALMLAVAPIVGLLDIVLSFVLGRNPYSFGVNGDIGATLITLFLIVFYGVTVGALAMMREIVREAEI